MARNKRKTKRFPAAFTAQMHTLDSVISKIHGKITDLSLGGMQLETESDLDANTDLFLTFNLPIEVQGKIVYTDRKNAVRKYGIKFTRLGTVEKLHLEKYITVKFKRSK